MFEISTKNATSAVKILGLANEQAGIPSSSFVRISSKKEGRLHLSLGGDLSATVSLKGKGSTETDLLFVGRREFLSFFQTLSKKPLQLEMSNKKLSIKQGRRKATLMGTAEGVGYPEFSKIPKSGREVPLRKSLLSSLEIACNCSSGGPNTALHCIYLKDRKLLASDQILAFADKLQKSAGEKSLLLPMPVVPLLKTEGLEKLVIADGRVVLKFSAGLISHPLPEKSVEFPTETVDSLLQGKTHYIRERKEKKEEKVFCLSAGQKSVKEYRWPAIFSLPVARFDELLRRFSIYLNGVERLRACVTVDVVRGEEQAQFCASTQYAKFNEKVKLPKAADRDCSVKLPVELILPFAKYWVEKNNKDSVKIYCDKEAPCLLICGESRLMVPSAAMEDKK